MVKLTKKHELFAEEYLTDLNATQAAIRAGYSKKTANEQGARLLANVSIQKYIKEQLKIRQERNKITQDMIIDELRKLGFAEIDADSLKPADKLKALELIARMLGLDKPKENGNNGMLEQLIKELHNA